MPSPASIDRNELTLAINEVETACDISIAMEADRVYGLNAKEAGRVLEQVQAAVALWRGGSNPAEYSNGGTRPDEPGISDSIT
jgi:hypothetical protein